MSTTTNRRPVTAEELDAALSDYAVIYSHGDGTISDVSGVHAPEYDTEGGTDPADPAGWDMLRGYTGQWGYNGPVMHASEYVGGALARDILDTPGTYTVVYVSDLADLDAGPYGWAVAHIPAE